MAIRALTILKQFHMSVTHKFLAAVFIYFYSFFTGLEQRMGQQW
jgi:hypothetical protein